MIGAVCHPAPSLAITLALRDGFPRQVAGRGHASTLVGRKPTPFRVDGSEQLRDSRFPMLRQVYAPLLIRFTEPETHGVLQHQQDYAGHDE